MTTATDLSEVLLAQWQESPRLRAIVTDIIEPMRDEALDALDRIELMRDIDEAEGVWLDYLGRWIGIERPATADPSQDPRFGFDDAGEAFDQAPFAGSAASAQSFPLPDATWRRFVKARAIAVLGDGTIQTFAAAVGEIDSSATVTDNRDMTVDVTTTLTELMQLADDIGALPRAAGVSVTYAAP